MPFKSKQQMRWMFANHPTMAKRWAKHTSDTKKLPEKKKKTTQEKAADLMADVSRLAFHMDSKSVQARMSVGSHDMNKTAAGELLKLDAKGISPAALQAVYSRDTHGAMQHPGVVALVARRHERLRRLKDELNNPGSHLKPEKEEAAPMEEAAEMAGSPTMPTAPGEPQPPSNLLSMFGPETGGMGVPAAGAAGMAAGGMLPKPGGHPSELIKLADEEGGAESPAEEAAELLPPAIIQELVNTIVGKGQGIDDEDVHGKAEELGVDPHEAEEEIYRLLASLVGGENDLVPGGLAAGMPTEQFPPEQLAKGREIELEHTSNPAIANEITKDHLAEGEDYVKPRLIDLEEGMDKAKEEGKIEGVNEGTPKSEQNIARKDEDVKRLEKTEKAARVSAYKYGFFAKVAELGMLPSEFMKVADGLAEGAGDMGRWALDKTLSAGGTAVKVPLVLAPLLGLLLGGSYRALTAPDYETPEELRDTERIALYKRLGREAQRRASQMQKRRLAGSGEEERKISVPSIEAA